MVVIIMVQYSNKGRNSVFDLDKCRMKAFELDDNRIWKVALTVPLRKPDLIRIFLKSAGRGLKNKNTNV